jgi:hypothetical protein
MANTPLCFDVSLLPADTWPSAIVPSFSSTPTELSARLACLVLRVDAWHLTSRGSSAQALRELPRTHNDF